MITYCFKIYSQFLKINQSMNQQSVLRMAYMYAVKNNLNCQVEILANFPTQNSFGSLMQSAMQ